MSPLQGLIVVCGVYPGPQALGYILPPLWG